MSTSEEPGTVTFRATTTPGAGRYEVVRAGQTIGTVGRFTMGAGQFGTTWMATTAGRTKVDALPNPRGSRSLATRAAGRLATHLAGFGQ